jgi:signal transduction histidine kinase
MRLWQKLSLISISILTLVVITCSALLLLHAKNNILQLTTENARVEQSNLSVSFSEMADYYLTDDINPVVQTSAVKYCFSRFANETSVLVHNTETLYSSVNIKPEEILPLAQDGEQAIFLDEITGRNILIAGGYVNLLSENYSVYVVRDITEVYNSIIEMFWRFVLISGISIVVGTSLIMILVHRTSIPLIRLKEMTRRISVGEYGERVNISSEDEVGELAADFNAMADAVQSHIASLEDTAQRQQLFIGGLTHEFKTPMTSMIIHTDTLLSTKLSEEQARLSLSHIHEQCRWLEQLTQKLLKLITLDEDINMKPEPLKDLFADIVRSTSETLMKRNTPLKTEWDNGSLVMDYDLMKSLLINLINNASKASEVGQPIFLRARGKVIEVIDSGKGISKDEIPHATDPFYMADPSRSKAKGGSGLGLTLVKRIADAHNVQLVIESEINVGTTVRLIFPDNKTFTS